MKTFALNGLNNKTEQIFVRDEARMIDFVLPEALFDYGSINYEQSL